MYWHHHFPWRAERRAILAFEIGRRRKQSWRNQSLRILLFYIFFRNSLFYNFSIVRHITPRSWTISHNHIANSGAAAATPHAFSIPPHRASLNPSRQSARTPVLEFPVAPQAYCQLTKTSRKPEACAHAHSHQNIEPTDPGCVRNGGGTSAGTPGLCTTSLKMADVMLQGPPPHRPAGLWKVMVWAVFSS